MGIWVQVQLEVLGFELQALTGKPSVLNTGRGSS